MAAEVRSYESIGRYGGEEFLVGSRIDSIGAGKQAERLRQRVASKEFNIGGAKVAITLSLGVASSCHLECPSEELLIELADAAMYRAKHTGRNRVEVATNASSLWRSTAGRMSWLCVVSGVRDSQPFQALRHPAAKDRQQREAARQQQHDRHPARAPRRRRTSRCHLCSGSLQSPRQCPRPCHSPSIRHRRSDCCWRSGSYSTGTWRTTPATARSDV